MFLFFFGGVRLRRFFYTGKRGISVGSFCGDGERERSSFSGFVRVGIVAEVGDFWFRLRVGAMGG